MGNTTSHNNNESDEHMASDDEEAQQRGRVGQHNVRRERESESESSESETESETSEREEEDDEGRRRDEENGSYYGDLLFGGGRIEDIFGGSRFAGERRIARPPRVHQTRSVVCDINLAKETLRLLPIPTEQDGATQNTLYQVCFNFDSNVDCRIRLFFAAQERRDDQNHLIGYMPQVKTEVPAMQFAAALGQEYVQPLSNPLDISLFQESELEYNPQTQIAPVVIVIEPLTTDIQHKVTSQTTFATLLKCSDGTYAVKAVKVKIEYCGTTYVVHDIYGLDQGSDSGRECVICMTDPRDTIVLPCRHMCLCRGCAEVLRYQTNKCPICRSLFTALLKIEVSDGEVAVEEEEGGLKSKKKKRGEKGDQKHKEHKKKKKGKKENEEKPSTTMPTGEVPAEESLHSTRDVTISVAN